MTDQYSSDERYWKERFQRVFSSNEMRGDFIMWLFDNELDYLNYNETWDKFLAQEYNEVQTTQP